jgi:hypothetical protein
MECSSVYSLFFSPNRAFANEKKASYPFQTLKIDPIDRRAEAGG